MAIVSHESERISHDNVAIIHAAEFLHPWSLDSVKSNKDASYFYIKLQMTYFQSVRLLPSNQGCSNLKESVLTAQPWSP